MCGIAGIFNLDGASVSVPSLKLMTNVLEHRGPDGEGFWQDRNIGLGHRRLSVIDLSIEASQPMQYIDRYIITFNGEIYNYLELRKDLTDKGFLFKTQSDTEVLLVLFHNFRDKMLDLLDGMFAFAIWDKKERGLFCARDRFGEKPFYYSYIPGKSFVFASEAKALFNVGIEKKVSMSLIYKYLAYDIIEDPQNKSHTFFDGIKKLEASHCLLVSENDFIDKKYWNINLDKKLDVDINEAKEHVNDLLSSSIRKRLRSDVEVGSSLSGGLDSSSIVCLIKTLQCNLQIKTFSARFRDSDLDEGQFINIVSQFSNSEHHNIWSSEDALIKNIDKIYYHHEEPIGGPSAVCQWEVMSLAKQNNTTVLLDGQGADEVFAGYHKYFTAFLFETVNKDKREYLSERDQIKQLHNKNYSLTLNQKLRDRFPYITGKIAGINQRHKKRSQNLGISDSLVAYESGTPPFKTFNSLNETLYYDTFIYGLEKLLRLADRNSMAFSREIRLPFLSHELVEYVFSLPANFKIKNGYTKYILRKGMENVLPNEICWRIDKKGYNPPFTNWQRNPKFIELIKTAEEFLKKEKIITKGMAPWKMIDIYMLLK